MRKKVLGFVIKAAVTVGLFTLLFRPQTFGLRPDFWGGDIEWEPAQLVDRADEPGALARLTFDLGGPLRKNRIKLEMVGRADDGEVLVECGSDRKTWETFV